MTVAGFLPGIWQAISLLGAVGSMVKSSEEREDEAVDESIRRGLQQAFHTACQRSASPIVIVRNAGGPDQHQVTYELVHHHTGTVRYVIADPLAQPRAALVQAESAAREAEANSKTLKARVAPVPPDQLGQAEAALANRRRELTQARRNLAAGALNAAMSAAVFPGEDRRQAHRAVAAALTPRVVSSPPAPPAVDPTQFGTRPGAAAPAVAEADYDSFYRGLVTALRGY